MTLAIILSISPDPYRFEYHAKTQLHAIAGSQYKARATAREVPTRVLFSGGWILAFSANPVYATFYIPATWKGVTKTKEISCRLSVRYKELLDLVLPEFFATLLAFSATNNQA